MLDGGPLPSCSYVEVIAGLVWRARCQLVDGVDSSLFCIDVYAVSGLLPSPTRRGCLALDVTSPTWTTPPTLSRDPTDASQLLLLPPAPVEPSSGPCTLEWAMCMHIGCEAFEPFRGNASLGLPTGITNQLLTTFTGWAWVALRATNTLGMQSELAVSNRVPLGPSAPVSDGVLVLGQPGTTDPTIVTRVHEAELNVSGFLDPYFGVSSFTWCVEAVASGNSTNETADASAAAAKELFCGSRTFLPHRSFK